MEKIIDMMDVFPIYGYADNAIIAKEKGCITYAIRLTLPEVYGKSEEDYRKINNLYDSMFGLFGEHTLFHSQHQFFEEKYKVDPARASVDFMTEASENHFKNRTYNRLESFLFISKVPKHYMGLGSKSVNTFLKKKRAFFMENIVPKEYLDQVEMEQFLSKVHNAIKMFNSSGLYEASLMDYDELFSDGGYYHTYLSQKPNPKDLSDISFDKNEISVGSRKSAFFTLSNLDQFKNDYLTEFEHLGKFCTDSSTFPISKTFPLGFKIQYEHIINEYVYVPGQEEFSSYLEKKLKKFTKFSSGKGEDSNAISADEISEFLQDIRKTKKTAVFSHFNVMGISKTADDYEDMTNEIMNVYEAHVKITPKFNQLDRKDLFFAGMGGNGIGIPNDLYMPMRSDMASLLTYCEGEAKDPAFGVNGMRLVDRVTGRPLSVSVYEIPEKEGWIQNRGMLVASGSGGGKSFFCNHYLAPELRKGGEAIILEDGNSYDRITRAFNGVILQHDPKQPFSFNPFTLDKYDVVEKDGEPKITEDKQTRILSLVNTLLGLGKETDREKASIRASILETMIFRYYQAYFKESFDLRFDTFFDFLKLHIEAYLIEKRIEKVHFDPNVYLLLLEKFYTGEVWGNLLNSEDPRFTNLSEQKVVYFKLKGIIDNEVLFPIISIMLMELYNKKLKDPAKKAINKIMMSDEAWGLLMRPELEGYFNNQSRTARKEGGQPIFISQKVDDFVASEVIKNAIVVNSHIKLLLDMDDFSKNFGPIQELMGLSKKQVQQVLALNKDLPEDRKLREGAFCWKKEIGVYGLEVSLEEKCIYESNPQEQKKIRELERLNDGNLEQAAIDYALP